MKRRLLPFLALLCALAVLPCAAQAADGDWGSDYETASQFRIYTADDLFAFAEMVNNGYDFEGKYVSLENTIDISGREWIPIGFSREHPFRGNFTSYNGASVYGLTYTSGNEPASGAYAVGLFGYVSGNANINPLTLHQVSIDVQAAGGRGSLTGVGSVVGAIDMYGTNAGDRCSLFACSVDGHISVRGDDGISVGGVVGQAEGGTSGGTVSINNCHSTVSTENAENIGITGTGGILGSSSARIDLGDCVNEGSVTGDANVGGIVGYISSPTADKVADAENNGTVTGNSYIGGIMGWSTNVGADQCTNSGIVYSDSAGDVAVGGIAGSFSRTTGASGRAGFSYCINNGTVDAPQMLGVGGIIGSAGGGPEISDCTNNGQIYGYTSVGGICGNISPSDDRTLHYLYLISGCQNMGDVDGYGVVGGICGSAGGVERRYGNKATVYSNENHGLVTGNAQVGGVIGCVDIKNRNTDIWPAVYENKNLGRGYIGGAIIGKLDLDALGYDEDTNRNQRIYNNFWTNTIPLPAIDSGSGSWEKRIWGNGAYNTATGLLDEPYIDRYGNRIISIDGQIAPPEEPEEPEQPQEPEQITIRFDAGGITSDPDTMQVKPGASIFLPSLADTEDQRFLGWTVNGVDYQAGDTVAVYEDMVFTARWEAIGEDPGADTVQEVWMTIGSSLFTADGEERSMDTAPFISNSRTYVPIRALAEAFGAQVEWDGIGRTVTIDLDGSTIVMYMGSVTYFVNGDVMEMDVEPVIVNSRTCVPVRFVTEAVGFRVTPHYSPFDHTTEAVQFNRY